jgi:hypothetical protein
MAWPQTVEHVFKEVVVQLVGEGNQWDDQQRNSSASIASPNNEPDPDSKQNNSNRPKLIPVCDEWPNEIADRIGYGPIDEKQKTAID